MKKLSDWNKVPAMQWPLLIFDLDGTLIDSAEDITSALNKTLEFYGKPPLPHEVVVAHIGEGLRKLLADFFPEHKNSPTETYRPIQERFLRTYEEEMYKTTRPFPGAVEFLQNYPGLKGVVTNKNEDPAKKIIRHLGLDTIPWVGVFGADTWSEKKPHPLPLQEMMKRAGHSATTTFMIGDGTPDMAAAQNAGVRAIAVEFGYSKIEILQKYAPVATFKDYAELHNLILELINR
ncbi:HAD family hydrolase [Bdellovibrio sp. HCB337]|uniref:HAD family hydrolase n=1 Tax=Bdellovibrio sp. HCB337 TaxID=3394358 RepID=UPI0039A61586